MTLLHFSNRIHVKIFNKIISIYTCYSTQVQSWDQRLHDCRTRKLLFFICTPDMICHLKCFGFSSWLSINILKHERNSLGHGYWQMKWENLQALEDLSPPFMISVNYSLSQWFLRACMVKVQWDKVLEYLLLTATQPSGLWAFKMI